MVLEVFGALTFLGLLSMFPACDSPICDLGEDSLPVPQDKIVLHLSSHIV